VVLLLMVLAWCWCAGALVVMVWCLCDGGAGLVLV
jgi:hypothetical protein